MKIAVVVFALAATACVNMSTLQTAKALEPGKGRILIGGGYYASPSVDAEVEAETGEDEDVALPYLEVGYRRGIVDKLELGAKATLPGTLALDGKYELVNNGKFAVAAGLGAGYLSIESGEDDDKTSTTLIDIFVPLYASYDVSSAFAIYTSPKYVMRFASSEADGESASDTSHLVGGTAGIRLGNGVGVFLETSYLKAVSGSFDMVQVNGSLYF